MSKRKKSNINININKKRSRVILSDFGFDFTHTTLNTNINIREFTKQYHDTRHFEISFNPPLKKKNASDSSIRMIYMPNKSCNIKFNVIPDQTGRITILDQKHKYVTYSTHTIQLQSKQGVIPLLYISIRNTQLNGDKGALPIYTTLYTSLEHPRYVPLPFFPTDPNITTELDIAGGIDSRLISQHVRMTFKTTSPLNIASNTVLELLGYFVPEPNTKEALEYINNGGKKKENYDGWKGVNMRFGALMEEAVTFYLLDNNEQLECRECGYHSHPTNNDWGAMPDLILNDQSITTKDIPEELLDLGLDIDYHTGTAEIKSSRYSNDFKEYHIPQCIWHMMCVNVLWNDLIVYCEKKCLDETTRNWVIVKSCKKIRIFKHIETEDQMIDLITRSLQVKKSGNIKAFIELVHSEPYINIRSHFKKLVDIANNQAIHLTINEDKYKDIIQHRQQQQQQHNDAINLHPAIDRIEDRQAEIFRLYQEPKKTHYNELVAAIADQIAEYTLLLK